MHDDAWARSKRYLERIESHIPRWYSDEEKWFLRAYAVHVRWRMGDTDAAKAKAILREATAKRLSLEGHGLLLPVLFAAKETALVQQELQYLSNHGAETAGALSFGDAYEHGEYVLLASSRRADGVILEALLTVSPESEMVPKIVKGLLAHRKQGHWANTQEDTFILLALDSYFRVYEKTTPDFVARVWLGDGYAGEHAFRGRTTERSRIEIPMGYLSDPPGTRDLVIDKQGAGRLYYRIGMRYAPRDLKLAPADDGFYVQRAYEAIDDPADVRKDADGTWHIAAGSRVRVRLTMVARRGGTTSRSSIRCPPASRRRIPRSRRRARSRRTRARPTSSRGGSGGRAPGTSTRTCATTASRHSRRSSGTVRGSTPTSRAPRRRDTSWCRRRRQRRCTRPETFGRSGTDRVVIE